MHRPSFPRALCPSSRAHGFESRGGRKCYGVLFGICWFGLSLTQRDEARHADTALAKQSKPFRPIKEASRTLCLLSYTHHLSVAEAYGAREGGIEPPTFLRCPFGGPAGIETGSYPTNTDLRRVYLKKRDSNSRFNFICLDEYFPFLDVIVLHS